MSVRKVTMDGSTTSRASAFLHTALNSFVFARTFGLPRRTHLLESNADVILSHSRPVQFRNNVVTGPGSQPSRGLATVRGSILGTVVAPPAPPAGSALSFSPRGTPMKFMQNRASFP